MKLSGIVTKRMIVRTGVVWNGCEVLLSVPEVSNYGKLSKMFYKFFAWLSFRSGQVNVGDMIRGQEIVGGLVSKGSLGKVLNEHNSFRFS